MIEGNFVIHPEEAKKTIDKLIANGDPKEIGIFISLLSHRYIQDSGITKEQFITSLSNSIDKHEKEEK